MEPPVIGIVTFYVMSAILVVLLLFLARRYWQSERIPLAVMCLGTVLMPLDELLAVVVMVVIALILAIGGRIREGLMTILMIVVAYVLAFLLVFFAFFVAFIVEVRGRPRADSGSDPTGARRAPAVHSLSNRTPIADDLTPGRPPANPSI